MIVIKGMDRPANCEECKLKHMGICVPNTGRKFDKGYDGDWCPIAGEIPEKHGRLINADALMTKLESHRDFWADGVGIASKAEKLAFIEAMREVRNAPTILEAEEETNK